MPDAVETHLKRELMHAVWDMLLDDDFIKACDDGLEILCYDKILRDVFPWIYLYGADYPERVLLATVRNMGGCPCPRCFIKKLQIAETGMKRDMQRRQNIRKVDHWWLAQIEKARTGIFNRGLGVNSAFVEALLKDNSWVPTRNAFAKWQIMFVPDVLHEVELGVVKALFIHIVRLLYAHGDSAVSELDARFRQIPTFGRATIRKFLRNVSEMKQFAARDYEDIIQCALPPLEGLYPQFNKLLLDVCFDLATFHGMAKLRLHTNKAVADFRVVTTDMCASIRKFARDTQKIKTFETPRERDRRSKRAQAAKQRTPANAAANATSGSTAAPQPPLTAPAATGSISARREKVFNVETPKFHSLAYYPDSVKEHGSLDSHTTQNSEGAHRKPKLMYGKTNKRNHVPQIAAHDRRQRLLRRMRARREEELVQAAKKAAGAAENSEGAEDVRKAARAHRTVTSTILREALQPNEVTPRAAPDHHHRISGEAIPLPHDGERSTRMAPPPENSSCYK
ncbi:hypothetical protein GGX14DRAFT_579131 [Mycena pura]|uniref:Uncharacterized protein n=1 Tax=Mycena pura TaxID=153505 RepID=A0AAD6USP1_9AGAR|nr:hypothetical protein GGX14DRAFT_579131 [Mycena pura]